jgi:hypothetical protein
MIWPRNFLGFTQSRIEGWLFGTEASIKPILTGSTPLIKKAESSFTRFYGVAEKVKAQMSVNIILEFIIMIFRREGDFFIDLSHAFVNRLLLKNMKLLTIPLVVGSILKRLAMREYIVFIMCWVL